MENRNIGKLLAGRFLTVCTPSKGADRREKYTEPDVTVHVPRRWTRALDCVCNISKALLCLHRVYRFYLSIFSAESLSWNTVDEAISNVACVLSDWVCTIEATREVVPTDVLDE